MKHTKLLNPEFVEEFEVGKEVEYITDFEYTPTEYKIFNEFFNDLVHGENKEVYKNLFEVIDDISFRIFRNLISNSDNYMLNKDFIQDFINVLNNFADEVEKNYNLHNKILSKLKDVFVSYLDSQRSEPLIDVLTKYKIDFISIVVKSLRNIIKDIKNKSTEFILNEDVEKEITDLYRELSNKIKHQENWNINEIFSLYSELINKSKFNTLLMFFSRYISDVSETLFDDWKKENNIYSKIIRNDVINILRGKKLNIDYEKEQVLSHIINNFIAFNIFKNDERYFTDKKRYEEWHLTKGYVLRILNELKNELFTDMDAWKYLNPNFMKQFKDFDDFVENSGIKKDSDGFSLLYYFGMLYGYDKGLVSYNGDKSSFSEQLRSRIPIWKYYIKDYLGKQHLFLYKLNPDAIDNNDAHYNPNKLIKYFNISNKDSCVKNKILRHISVVRRNSFAMNKNIRFIIMADKNGNTIGRFIDYNNNTFSNIYYDGKAYDYAFEKGGRDIISKYLSQKNKNKTDFVLSYYDRDEIGRIDELKRLKNAVKGKLKDFWDVFYLNDIIIAKKKT